MQGRKEEWVQIGQGEKAGVGKRAQPETGEEGRECACRPVGGPQGLRGCARLGKRNSRVERPRGAFSRGPDVSEPMSLAMMRHGGVLWLELHRKSVDPGYRAPWSRKVDTSVYM